MTQQTAPSLAEFYADPASPYAAFPQEHRSGGSIPVTMMRVEQEAFEATDPAVSELTLHLLHRTDMICRTDFGEGWSEERKARSGDISLVPADTVSRYECRGAHDLVSFSVPTGILNAILDDHRAGTLSSLDPLVSATIFRDETIRRTMMQM